MPARASEVGWAGCQTAVELPVRGAPLLLAALLVAHRPSPDAACGLCCRRRRRRQSQAAHCQQLLPPNSLGWVTACWLLTEHGQPQTLMPLQTLQRLRAPAASRGCGWAPTAAHPGLALPLHRVTMPHETSRPSMNQGPAGGCLLAMHADKQYQPSPDGNYLLLLKVCGR